MLEFAKWQLNKLTEKCKDEDSKIMQNMMNNDILELLKVFSEQGHSGFSAPIAIRLFSKLANHKLITEVEDNPDDWDENGQHKFISSIFKRNDGTCYYLYGRLFAEPNSDNFFYNKASNVDITFPIKLYDLQSEYIRLHYNVEDKPIKEQLEDGDYDEE